MNHSRLKLLVVTPFPPRRDAGHGGGRITTEALVHLSGRFDVALLALRAPGEPGVDSELRERCRLVREVERVSVGRSPRALWRERRRIALAARRVPGWAVGHTVAAAHEQLDDLVATWNPDVVQLEFLVIADLVHRLPGRRPPIVLVDHDARPAPHTGSPAAWRRLRRHASALVDAFVVFTDADSNVVRADAGVKPVEVIPLGLDLPNLANGPEPDRNVLFVGWLAHAPNLDAAQHLVEAIHPRVRQRVPDAMLTIIGGGAPEAFGRDVGVVFEGHVPDLAPSLARAAVVVAPVTSGGGMRVKVLDALAAGKALVASSRAIEGLDVRHGEHLLVADGDEETANAIVEILRDGDRRRALEAAARAWAEHSLSWESRVAAYEALYGRLIGDQKS